MERPVTTGRCTCRIAKFKVIHSHAIPDVDDSEDVSLLFEYAVPIAPVQTVQDAYKKRKEIMENVSKTSPQWYEAYEKWVGQAPGSIVTA